MVVAVLLTAITNILSSSLSIRCLLRTANGLGGYLTAMKELGLEEYFSVTQHGVDFFAVLGQGEINYLTFLMLLRRFQRKGCW